MSRLTKDLIKYTPRKEQSDALEFIKKTYEENKENKFFLLNLPVGVGKSHLALMISDWYITQVDNSANIDIITAGKILQDQYTETYESINDLKGRENYTCEKYSCSCAQGVEFNRINKDSCTSCPYDLSVNGYMSGKVSLTNFYMYLIHAIFNEKMYSLRKRDILIVDECHELDQVISDFVSIRISENMIKKLEFTEQDNLLKELSNVSTTKEYSDFLKYLNDEVVQLMSLIENELKKDNFHDSETIKRDLKIKKLLGKKNKKVDLMEKMTDLKNLSGKFEIFIKEYEENPNNWVLESIYNEKTKSKEISAEPIWSGDYLEKYVWSRYKMVFLMSGTILNKKIFSELNGLENNRSIYYSIESPFPVENRTIYYMPLGKMSYAKKAETFKNFVPYIKKILKKYQDVKGIIHTNSFELSEWIKRDITDKRLLFHGSEDREKILKKHMESSAPFVIVSPSVSTGVSFEHDLSRFQVIAKIPYPSLGSKKNKLRQNNNPEWYQYTTVCKLIQMTGRSVRSKTDYADTLIIDESFSDILKWSSHYLPDWFSIAIKKVNVK
jgi:Rad3-related DNA helicase